MVKVIPESGRPVDQEKGGFLKIPERINFSDSEETHRGKMALKEVRLGEEVVVTTTVNVGSCESRS